MLNGATSLVLLTGKLSILNSTISKNTKHQKKYKEPELLLRELLRKTATFKK